jgi:hypothetical protein
MLSIYKFTFNPEWSVHTTINDYHIVEFLSAQLQNGKVTVWAIVDKEKENNVSEIFICGTGWSIGEDNKYWFSKENFINTVQDDWGLVWHVFGIVNPTKANEPVKETEQEEQKQEEVYALNKMPTLEECVKAFTKAYDIAYNEIMKEAEELTTKEVKKNMNNFANEHPSRANARKNILKNI